ncbi:WYL domain-containing protein [Lyngbya sp. CCAP 1446/10]|uniref:helix-turn-helix transcriptional regulator n=1 Tax=Lyngbya sp. CCAP 1446/10 TaxID=439293 RepID=UPI002238FEEB|nr:WYL domain-containing protein [Lyngbya sp. CCAP 1446/10]MCW6051653.1 WYL domain-containing protein [Lyngbya sp. CCAP 1446/10]
MSRKKEALTLSVPPETKEQLESIALRLGIKWGKSPSVSGLLVAIAQHRLDVGEPFTLNSAEVAALQQSIRLLIDSGYIEQARSLSQLLVTRGNLEAPLRQSLLQQVIQPTVAWRIQAEEYINEKQPFLVLYRNPKGEDLAYTVRYAEISFEEKRFYLEIWCEETDDIKNPDYPELIHNRCLRFDRIQSIVKTDGEWRDEGLAYLKVYLHFCRGMVNAYDPRARDISDRVVGDVREVVRRVSNPFWLIREVSRYWEDCAIVSPQKVRDRFQQKLIALCRHYDIDIPD